MTWLVAGLVAGAGLALAACGGPGGGDRAQMSEPYAASPPPPAPVAMQKAVALDEMESGAGPASAEPEAPAAEQFIAYSHALGMRLPRAQVEPVMQAHIEACRKAGTAMCVVVGSNLYNQSEDYASGNLSIRAKPEWIESFLTGIDGQAKAAGGEVTSRNVYAEDLTRPILDTQARLDSQVALRDRLMDLLNRPNAEVGDLIEVERELARVTGDIESMTAILKNLRLRVAMSSLDISYETKLSAVAPSRFNPLGQAFSDFFYNVSAALASVITAFAYGLPWLVLIGLFIFIWTRAIWPWVRKRRKKA